MSSFKKKWKECWKNVWECFKQSIAAGMMFFVASMVLFLVTSKSGADETNTLVTWAVICGLVASAYGGLLAFATGGAHYEMLVSGNMKRRSSEEFGSELNITSYKTEKEYRPWKGFLIGFLSVGITFVGGIVLGCNQSKLSAEKMGTGLSVLLFVLDLFGGWVMLPVQTFNRPAVGGYANGFLCCAFTLLPTVVSGLCYIWGAYARRNKTWRQAELARKAEEEAAAKPKKINYGGLPGTKPRKRK